MDVPVDPKNYTKTMKERVDLLLKELSKKAGKPTGEVKSATDSQG